MLMVWPVAQSSTTAREQGERDVQDNDQRAAPVAQEKQHHQPGESGSQQPFDHEAPDGIRHIGRLIELEPHIDVVGHDFLEIGNSRLHGIDDCQRRSVGALRHWDVDGALPVDVRIGGDDIGAVLDRADIAQVDRRAGSGPNGSTQQLGQIAAQSGVRPGDAVDLPGPHVARRHDQAGLADGGDGFVGRDADTAGACRGRA